MAEVTLCGHDGCDKHLTEYDINYDSRQTAQYKNRRGLCLLSIHPHSKLTHNSDWRTCVRCGYAWRVYSDTL